MKAYQNYEELRAAFVEGDITRNDFEIAAANFDGNTIFATEPKCLPWWQRLFNLLPGQAVAVRSLYL